MTKQQDNEKRAQRKLGLEEAAELWLQKAEAFEMLLDWEAAAQQWRRVAEDLRLACEVWADKAETETKEAEKWQYHAEHWLQIAHSLSEQNVMLLEIFDYKPPFEVLTDEQADRIRQAIEAATTPEKTKI